MLKIRFQRIGRRNNPAFRIIVANSTIGPKSGKFLEKLGFYNPIEKTKDIKKDRVVYWIKHGALVSDTVHNLLVSEGVIEGKKKNVLPKKTPTKTESNEGSEAIKEQKTGTEEQTQKISDSGEDDKTAPKSE